MDANATPLRFKRMILQNNWITEYPVHPSGYLQLAPAEIAAELGFAITTSSAEDCHRTFTVTVRLADNQGNLWQASLHLAPDIFLEKLIDLSRPEPPHFEDQSPAAWKNAFKRKSLIQDIRYFDDDRFYRFFVVDDRVFELIFKYLSVQCDLALLDSRTLLARVRGIWGAWNPHRIPGLGRGEFEEDDEGDDVDEYPPILFPITFQNLLSAAVLSPTDSEHWTGGSDLPIPLVFELIEGKGRKQKEVRLVACLSETSGVEREPVASKDYLPVLLCNDIGEKENYRREVTYQTNEQGFLKITADNIRGGIYLSFKSRSASHDVLSCLFRLADTEGTIWESEAIFTPEVFLESLYDLKSNTPPVPTSERGANKFRISPLLNGIRHKVDDNKSRVLVIDKEILVISFDWQVLRYDLSAIHAENTTYIQVILNGLTARRYPTEDVPQERFLKVDITQPASAEDAAMPSLSYSMNPSQFIFRNTTHAVDDGFWHRNDWPIPLIFHRVLGKLSPQEGVEFIPRATTTTN